MEIRRLRSADKSWGLFHDDWSTQCREVDEDFESYGAAPISMIRDLAEKDSDSEWAIGLYDKHRKQFFASACVILANQKGYVGKVLRVREVVPSPLLDNGKLAENEYADVMIHLLFGAVKLSETLLKAKHVKMHLRSPADADFFRAFSIALDSKGVFASVETHGAWMSFTKKRTTVLSVV